MSEQPLSYYGASGNNIDDDYYAIMLSFTRQGSIVLEDGCIYKFTQTIHLPSNATIKGAPFATLIYHGEGEGIIHYEGLTAAYDLNLKGMHTQVNNDMFGFRSDTNATGSIHMIGSQVHGFTNAVKVDENVSDCIFSDLDVYDLKGDESGEGYGLLFAGNGFEIENFSASGDRDNNNGRHGLYLSASAKNGTIKGLDIQDFAEGGLALYAMAHQSGVDNIDIYNANVSNCGGGVYNGGVGVFGKVSNINFYSMDIQDSKGGGLYLSAYGQGGTDNLNFYDCNIEDSDYLGVGVFGCTNTNFYGGKVHTASKAVAQTYSNIGVYSDWANNIQTDNVNFYAVESTCAPNTSRNAAYINPSVPVPVNIGWYNMDWQASNFAEPSPNI